LAPLSWARNMADIIVVLLECLSIAGLLMFAIALVRAIALTNGPVVAVLAAISLTSLALIESIYWRII
jgi:hypothetical protein